MDDTSLGVDVAKSGRVSQERLPPGRYEYAQSLVRGAVRTGSPEYGGADDDWNWNSQYWWNLGSPWGGMLSTAGDLVKLLNLFLGYGSRDDTTVLSPQTTIAMTSNQVDRIAAIPPEVRRSSPWGFGWELKTPFGSRFGDIVSSRTFGHSGATGALVWADPASSLACAMLSNQPYDEVSTLFARFSNAVAGSLLD